MLRILVLHGAFCNSQSLPTSGVITGLYVDTKNVAHGFVRNKGKFRTVSLPDVAGINNAGVFVGSYIAKNKKNYGYIATPQSCGPHNDRS
jgi:hypothetical protein